MYTVASMNLPFLLTFVIGFSATFYQSKLITHALKIEPNHDQPCIVGDAWAEECMSCICLEGRIVTCKTTFCATRLRHELDDCKEGEITKVNCNTCQCKNNVRECTKNDCGKGDQRHNPKLKKREKRRKRIKGKV